MSKPDHALTLPISDIDLSRDAGTKLRITGTVTAIDPLCSSLVLVSDLHPAKGGDAASVLVDLSLCAQHTEQPFYGNVSGDAGGWKSYRTELKKGASGGQGGVPPELKTKVMVIGHLVRRDLPIDISFLNHRAKIPLIESQVHPTVTELRCKGSDESALLPNPYFILEALLFKPLSSTFDLALWNHTARLRSQHEWSFHKQDCKGKRKAID